MTHAKFLSYDRITNKASNSDMGSNVSESSYGFVFRTSRVRLFIHKPFLAYANCGLLLYVLYICSVLTLLTCLHVSRLNSRADMSKPGSNVITGSNILSLNSVSVGGTATITASAYDVPIS